MKVALVSALAASALTAAVLVGGGIAGRSLVASTQGFVPACPRPLYAADGNFSPLFCVIDNPLALRNFGPIYRHTLALGPNASPGQVTNAMVADYNHGGTEPTLCSAYRLAAWRNHWRFGVSPVSQVTSLLRFPQDWCSDPHFAVSS